MLQVLDQCWKDHLLYLDQLRQSIGLRAYGQKDPLNEYKKEAFQLFEMMLSKISFMITSILAKAQIEETNTSEKSFPIKEKIILERFQEINNVLVDQVKNLNIVAGSYN